jgi:hypothetical protein
MEAKNLRIGNFVKDRGNKVIRIDFMEYQESGYSTKFGQRMVLGEEEVHPMTEYTDYAIPIELTEKWMFDLGFKYQDRDVNRSDKKKERFYISPRFGQEFWFEIQLPENTPFKHSFVRFMWNIGGGNHFIHLPKGHELKYVHELQNLFFALSGTELQLKNECSTCG